LLRPSDRSHRGTGGWPSFPGRPSATGGRGRRGAPMLGDGARAVAEAPLERSTIGEMLDRWLAKSHCSARPRKGRADRPDHGRGCDCWQAHPLRGREPPRPRRRCGARGRALSADGLDRPREEARASEILASLGPTPPTAKGPDANEDRTSDRLRTAVAPWQSSDRARPRRQEPDRHRWAHRRRQVESARGDLLRPVRRGDVRRAGVRTALDRMARAIFSVTMAFAVDDEHYQLVRSAGPTRPRHFPGQGHVAEKGRWRRKGPERMGRASEGRRRGAQTAWRDGSGAVLPVGVARAEPFSPIFSKQTRQAGISSSTSFSALPLSRRRGAMQIMRRTFNATSNVCPTGGAHCRTTPRRRRPPQPNEPKR